MPSVSCLVVEGLSLVPFSLFPHLLICLQPQLVIAYVQSDPSSPVFFCTFDHCVSAKKVQSSSKSLFKAYKDSLCLKGISYSSRRTTPC